MYAWTLPSAPSPAQDGSWQLTVGILSHWVPAHHLPSGPHLTSCLSGFTQDTQFFSLSLDDQAPSNSWARTGAILSPWNTLSPVLTRGTLLKRSSHREDVVNHLSDMVPLLLPSWCPVTFLVHILCKHVLTDDYGFNVHLSPLCSRSTRITLHAGGGIHIC